MTTAKIKLVHQLRYAHSFGVKPGKAPRSLGRLWNCEESIGAVQSAASATANTPKDS